MPLEVELKFFCDDLAGVRSKLKAMHAKRSGRHFEHNLVFERSAGQSLKEHGILLRLRKGEGCTLTLKRRPKVACGSGVKVREEIETRVSDFDSTRRILEILGFEKKLVYEKVRETWEMESCEICLDRLPFGSFVEIEGDRDAIFKCASTLGLDRSKSSTKNYHQLFREFQIRQGKEPLDSFPFAEPLRSELILESERDHAE